MARSSFGRGELLLAALRLLEDRPMAGQELRVELERRIGADYRVTSRGLAVALDSLAGEALVELDEHGAYRVTAAGSEALHRRREAPVLRHLDRSEGGAIERVTLLFTDIVGSTELLERLGEEEAHGLRRRHFALLRRSLDEHGGREVKSLGDGLMVTFREPPEAIACARAMQAAVNECDDPLELRIGIASGEVVCEEADYFGRPVVVARRLCDAARGGDVLVAGAPADGFEPQGSLVLKGLTEPVPASLLKLRPLAVGT
jgi:class 3 adenylate cyclase